MVGELRCRRILGLSTSRQSADRRPHRVQPDDDGPGEMTLFHSPASVSSRSCGIFLADFNRSLILLAYHALNPCT